MARVGVQAFLSGQPAPGPAEGRWVCQGWTWGAGHQNAGSGVPSYVSEDVRAQATQGDTGTVAGALWEPAKRGERTSRQAAEAGAGLRVPGRAGVRQHLPSPGKLLSFLKDFHLTRSLLK